MKRSLSFLFPAVFLIIGNAHSQNEPITSSYAYSEESDLRGTKNSPMKSVAMMMDNRPDQTLNDDFHRGKYIDENKPNRQPQVFAKGFISTDDYEFGSVFNKDLTEFYFGVELGHRSEIRYSQLLDGVWTDPVTIVSHERYGYNDPFLSPDEQKLYFISQRPLDGRGEMKDYDIWYVEKS
ncbi:MAG: hypothetical protein AAFO69_18780, partial [Bacteroidota bacterium]